MWQDAILILFASVCTYVALTPRIHTGTAGTAGLGLLACSALALLDVWASPMNVAMVMVVADMLVVWQWWHNSRTCKRRCVFMRDQEPEESKVEFSRRTPVSNGRA